MRRAGVWILGFLVLSCGGPLRVTRAYLRALHAEKYERAYRLRSAEARAHFQKPTQKEREGVASLLESSPTVSSRAHLLSEAGEVFLQETERGWVISGGLLDFYSQDSPREALRAFVLAVERRRYDVLYSLAPLRFQKEMTVASLEEEMEKDRPEILRKALQLQKHLHEPIRVSGETAVLFYPEGGAELLYEGGKWRVFHLR